MEQKNQPRLILENVCKSFPSKDYSSREVVRNVSFEVREGEFLVLLGPGHCGKSVIMDMIAGLTPRDSGSIKLDGNELTGVSPKIGMVFQKLGLMPWKTVMQNVELGPKMLGVSVKQRRETAQYYLELVGLKGFENSYPYQLSGGMKQRVGIARAYANDPQILLMDEPFGQLDAQTRYKMQDELLKILTQEKRTIIFVTSNMEEALCLGDRILLFTGCPARVKKEYIIDFERPRDMMVDQFLQMRKDISDNTDLAI